MTIGPVIEVLIGLIFMFFVFSVLSSGVNEYISRALQKRVDFLAAGIAQLLTAERPDTPAKTPAQIEAEERYLRLFWNHPLVKQLGQSLEGLKEWWLRRAWRVLAKLVHGAAKHLFVSRVGKAARVRREKAEELAGTRDENIRRLPSYMPTATFVAVLEDITKKEPPAEGTTLKQSLAALHDLDPTQRLANYGRWFDDQMERVSGWYKRESKSILFAIGLVVVIAMNVDTIAVARTLWKDPTTRALVNDAVTAQLEASGPATTTGAPGATTPPTTASPALVLKVVCKKADAATGAAGAATTTTAPSAEDALRSTLECATQFPIGWRFSKQCLSRGESAPEPCNNRYDRAVSAVLEIWRHRLNALLKALGLLITAAALSFGAPFWFEFLNKFANLRGAGAKPAPTTPEKAK